MWHLASYYYYATLQNRIIDRRRRHHQSSSSWSSSSSSSKRESNLTLPSFPPRRAPNCLSVSKCASNSNELSVHNNMYFRVSLLGVVERDTYLHEFVLEIENKMTISRHLDRSRTPSKRLDFPPSDHRPHSSLELLIIRRPPTIHRSNDRSNAAAPRPCHHEECRIMSHLSFQTPTLVIPIMPRRDFHGSAYSLPNIKMPSFKITLRSMHTHNLLY